MNLVSSKCFFFFYRTKLVKAHLVIVPETVFGETGKEISSVFESGNLCLLISQKINEHEKVFK